ncbi:MAG: UvrD-helicase domain-containing protein [Gudongella sp.]|nr:UvrD-helicase domain-containing protein [Gudongella sp.]
MDRQQQAIQTIDMNLAVSAGAGTGKTKVLTERYVHILENGDLDEGREIESLVAITFTKKASTEMKERIEQEIASRLDHGERWRRLYRDFSKAYIMTIHSFCGKLLRENPVQADIDPGFTVLEEYVADRMLRESAGRVLDRLLKEEDNLKTISLLGKKDIGPLSEELMDIYKKIRTLGITIDEAMEKTLSHISGMEIGEEVLQEIRETALYLGGEMGRGKFVSVLKEPEVQEFLQGEEKRDQLRTVLQLLGDNMGSSKKAPEAQQRLKELLQLALATFEKEKLDLYILTLNIVKEMDREYSARKKDQGALDYEDLQIQAHNLLQQDEILRKYQDRFRYIMIDEFQDTNQLQKKIFYRLASCDNKLDRGNLFVVGDPKQSIYAFRGADIQVFYDVVGDIEASHKGRVITLTENYRTVSTVLELVDRIFAGLLGDRYNPLNPNKLVDRPVEVEVLYKEDFSGSSQDTQELEADQIARRIRFMVDNEELHGNRKVKYRDVALLFRAMTRSSIYEDALRRYNIPYTTTGGVNFYQRDEILDLINALKVISNPSDMISMVGFLRGGFAGLSDEAIFHLLDRYEREENVDIVHTMGKVLEEKEVELDGLDYGIMEETAKLLKRLFILKNHLGVGNLLAILLESTGFQESQLLMYQGMMRSRNVDAFLKLVEDYEITEGGSLEELIDYIENRRIESEGDGIVDSGGDSVSLMSIHKSKGLQFPVVVIPEMGRRGAYDRAMFQFDKDMGLGIKNGDSSYYEIIYKDTRDNLQEEIKRLIYVAMTRAEERLILGYQGKNSGFKALVDDYLEGSRVRIVSDFPVQPQEAVMVKPIVEPAGNVAGKAYPLLEFHQHPVAGRETYSISQYQKYISCPREYFLTYKMRLTMVEDNAFEESPGSAVIDGATKGILVHEFCRYYREDQDKGQVLSRAADSLGVELTEEVIGELEPYVDNFIAYSTSEYGYETEVEKEFYVKLGNHVVTGFIDRLEHRGDEKRIIDIKTNRLHNREDLMQLYRPQLMFYRWAAVRILETANISSAILFLEDGSVEDIAVSIGDEKLLLQDMERAFDYIEIHHEPEDYPIGKNCREGCRYRAYCHREED